MYKKILVPLGGSELAKKALEHAEELAKTYGAQIILLQIVPLISSVAPPDLVAPFINDEMLKEVAQTNLTKLAEEMKIRGHKVTAIVRTSRQVALEIIDFAKKNGVDLIIMFTHGRSGITRWVLGSVAQEVLTRAETPTLLVHLKR